MLHCPVNGYDMAYIEVGQGQGTPLVCVHGSLSDYRVWSCVLGPLSRQHRVIAPSLRHFFPEHWDGVGNDYTMAQHVTDTIGFIEALDQGNRIWNWLDFGPRLPGSAAVESTPRYGDHTEGGCLWKNLPRAGKAWRIHEPAMPRCMSSTSC